MSESYFSKTYAEARSRFNLAASAVGATLFSYPIDVECGDELAIDVATLGPEIAPTIVTSSGVHGVEGFFGSAIQLAFLGQLDLAIAKPNLRYVFIHGVNPFGFARLRRFNEDNVDLNRNFLSDIGDYTGAPDGYARLNGLLNPESPPSRWEPFKLKAAWNIWCYGLQSLKQSVAGGQYEYPRGLFFGGHGPCQATQRIIENCDSWIGSSERIVHIDFHSGLGPFGTYKLLLAEGIQSENGSWYAAAFGADRVEPLDASAGTAYRISGRFGEWMQQNFGSREYRFVGAEFGTYEPLRVLKSLRTENRAYHYGSEHTASYESAKAELLECFCPSDISWRNQVIESGLKIIAQGAQALARRSSVPR